MNVLNKNVLSVNYKYISLECKECVIPTLKLVPVVFFKLFHTLYNHNTTINYIIKKST